jgi:diaminopimelate epimerase
MALYPFWKVTPGGNPTILLRSQDIPPAHRASVAASVMSLQHIGGEQVGYVRFEGVPRLDMMGGEFCLNATRAFAAVLASRGLLKREGAVLAGSVEVSGADGPVHIRVTERNGALPLAEACLHFDDLPQPETCGDGSSLIRVPGIVHLIHQGNAAPLPDEPELSAFCASERRALALEQEEAVGHLWLRHAAESRDADDASALVMDPVVWVRDTATLCFESACGSGTLACALAEHAATGATAFSVVQPSGSALSVRMEKAAQGWDVWVGGPARVTASGETDLCGLL